MYSRCGGIGRVFLGVIQLVLLHIQSSVERFTGLKGMKKKSRMLHSSLDERIHRK